VAGATPSADVGEAETEILGAAETEILGAALSSPQLSQVNLQ